MLSTGIIYRVSSVDGIILFLIVFSILLIIDVAVASKFSNIAEDKGYSGFFGWCFFLPPIGMLMVVALPDRRKETVDYTEMLGRIAETLAAQKTEVEAEHFDSLPEI